MMKVVALTLVMVLGLAGCGTSSDVPSQSPELREARSSFCEHLASFKGSFNDLSSPDTPVPEAVSGLGKFVSEFKADARLYEDGGDPEMGSKVEGLATAVESMKDVISRGAKAFETVGAFGKITSALDGIPKDTCPQP